MKRKALKVNTIISYNGNEGKIIEVIKTPNHREVVFYVIEVNAQTVNVLPSQFSIVKEVL